MRRFDAIVWCSKCICLSAEFFSVTGILSCYLFTHQKQLLFSPLCISEPCFGLKSWLWWKLVIRKTQEQTSFIEVLVTRAISPKFMENAIFSSECACVFDLIINAVPNKQSRCSLSFFNSQRHSFDVGVKKISRILKYNVLIPFHEDP